MKKIFFAILLLALPLSATAPTEYKTLTLTNGKVYESVKVREIEPDGIRIMHAGGMAKVPYEKLTEETQKELGGFDPKKAKEFRGEDAKAQNVAAKAQRRRDAAIIAERSEVKRGEATDASKIHVSLEIVQIIKGGALCKVATINKIKTYKSVKVKSGNGLSGHKTSYKKVFTGYRESTGAYQDQWILVRANLDKWVDGDAVTAWLLGDGNYTYTTTLGSSKKIRAYRAVDAPKTK